MEVIKQDVECRLALSTATRHLSRQHLPRLLAAGLREAWDEGNLSRFHGWDTAGTSAPHGRPASLTKPRVTRRHATGQLRLEKGEGKGLAARQSYANN